MRQIPDGVEVFVSVVRSTDFDPVLRPGALALAMLVLAFVSGCAAQPAMPDPSTVKPFGQNATFIYVPGIGGVGHEDRAWIEGVRAGGYKGSTAIWDWSGRLGALDALWAHGHQQAEARKIADQIVKIRSESPGEPITLVAHSAGTAVAVYALEHLPSQTNVDDLVLLAPALSRSYDLTKALRHVRGRADVFYSERDTLVLAIGTFLFGTADGIHGESAGHGGFVAPRRADPLAYARLHAHPYSRERQKAGDDGGHEGILSPHVAAVVIAPLLPRPEARADAVAVIGQ